MTQRIKTKYPGIMYRERVKGRVYEIAYADSNGRRVFQTVPGGLRDAIRARNLILEKLARGELVAPSKKLVTELADLYLESATYLRPNTRMVYESAVKAQIKPRLGNRRVSYLTRRTVGNLVADMQKDDLAAWTIRGTLTVLSGMCSFAMDEGWLGVNPVLQLTRRQRPTGTRSDMRILSSEEIAQLLRHSQGNHRDLFRLLIFTGLRISEALALDWEDVDFDLACVRIRSSKTDAGVRSVELPEFLLRSLASMNGESGPVFLNQNGNRMYKRQVQKFFKTTLKRAKLDDMRLHDLRHTFASLLIAQGEDIVYVASQMGHSNASTTLRVYAKLFDGDKRKVEARERMHEAFGHLVVTAPTEAKETSS